MSFDADKKREHATLAERSMNEGALRKAAFHLAKAGEFALKLAEKCDGKVRQAHLREARELIEVGEELQAKAPRGSARPSAPRAVREAGGDAVRGEEDWLVTEKPNVRLTDIAGMDAVKAKLAEMVIEPLKHPDKAREWGIRAGGGILLFGPPGNGKTTLGKAVAGELEAAFFYATGAEIRSKWHGESEQRLRKLIQTARSRPLSVLFLDDLDGLLPKRGGNSVVDNRIVVQFLAEVGGFEESPNVLLLLGATNKPWDIDEAVFRTGRFDEKIFVDLPDLAAREFMVQRNLGGAPVEAGLDARVLAARLDGYTGSDIVAILQSAKRTGFRRSIGGAANLLTQDDIEQALKTIPSSATPEMMREYKKFAQARFK
ncbi:MAG: ATP-binding protein [Verrucomicrobia bacterium]|nr:ATP-binding protein [Verrucomicrobiota bacterium]